MGPFDGQKVRGQFAGHETFPLRLLWLKKSHEVVGKNGVALKTFHDPQAIVNLGVGKNMAISMRHWSIAANCIEESNNKLVATSLGRAILADDGFDPYLECSATLWLIHWNLASKFVPATTIYYAFNGIAGGEFDVETLNGQLADAIAANGWRASAITLQRDIEVFLRSYVTREDVDIEDAAEPLLAELGLVRKIRSGGWYEFVRGSKPSLPNAIFIYALLNFWDQHHPSLKTLTAEQVCYDVGSPGRVFKLDEDSVVTRLLQAESLTEGALRWTDTAGLRQVQRTATPEKMKLIARAYQSRVQSSAQ